MDTKTLNEIIKLQNQIIQLYIDSGKKELSEGYFKMSRDTELQIRDAKDLPGDYYWRCYPDRTFNTFMGYDIVEDNTIEHIEFYFNGKVYKIEPEDDLVGKVNAILRLKYENIWLCRIKRV